MDEMTWYIPVLIFFARICDVSMGTVRMIFVINGAKIRAATLGFFEVMIWALAVGGLIKFLSNPVALVAYGGGFAAGTIIGMAIDEKMKLGYRIVQIINPDLRVRVTAALRDAGYRVTRLEGSGRDGPVEVCQVVVKRKFTEDVMKRVQGWSPRAFMSVERCDRAVGGPFGAEGTTISRGNRVLGRLGGVRK